MAPGLKKCVTICSWKRGAIFKSVSFDLPWVCFHEVYESQTEAFIKWLGQAVFFYKTVKVFVPIFEPKPLLLGMEASVLLELGSL